MSEATVTLLGFIVLAGLYAFFAWVLWTGYSQLRPTQVVSTVPRSASPPKTNGGSVGKITVLEPPSLAGQIFDIGDELTLGRAAACRLTLDDTYISQHHASIVRRDRQHFLEDTGSTNGTYVNRARITAPVILQPGDRVQIGSTVMEFA